VLDSTFGATAADVLNALEHEQGHWEVAYAYANRSGVEAVNDPALTAGVKASIAVANAGQMAERRHDYLTALAKRRAWIDSEMTGFDRRSRYRLALNLAWLHEATAARREAAADEAAEGTPTPGDRAGLALGLHDWPQAAAAADDWAASLQGLPDHGVRNLIWRWEKAEALARLGRLEEARAVIEPTPLDCVPCLMERGLIAALAGERAEADRWYAQAVRLTPSLADAPFAWAQALYARGERGRAIAQLANANRLAPRWADPLELWGEALLADGDARGAEARFAAAAERAPRWRDLRLTWAQALERSGKHDAAQAQRRLAAGMPP
jgi:tetratricopeptide (TPR) repeat protein